MSNKAKVLVSVWMLNMDIRKQSTDIYIIRIVLDESCLVQIYQDVEHPTKLEIEKFP